jgi:hypothetical protein
MRGVCRRSRSVVVNGSLDAPLNAGKMGFEHVTGGVTITADSQGADGLPAGTDGEEAKHDGGMHRGRCTCFERDSLCGVDL